jgi:transcriptional regulator with XRE-family HTH domain
MLRCLVIACHGIIEGMESIGDRVKRLRLEKGLSPGQLAYMAGISRNHLWRIEKGDRPKVGAEILARIASALGVGVDDLLRDPDAPVAHALAEARAAYGSDVTEIMGRLEDGAKVVYARCAVGEGRWEIATGSSGAIGHNWGFGARLVCAAGRASL